MSFFYIKTLRHTRNFSCIVQGADLQSHINSHTQAVPNPEQLSCRPYKYIVPCGNRTRDTLRSSQSLSHCANRAVNIGTGQHRVGSSRLRRLALTNWIWRFLTRLRTQVDHWKSKTCLKWDILIPSQMQFQCGANHRNMRHLLSCPLILILNESNDVRPVSWLTGSILVGLIWPNRRETEEGRLAYLIGPPGYVGRRYCICSLGSYSVLLLDWIGLRILSVPVQVR